MNHTMLPLTNTNPFHCQVLLSSTNYPSSHALPFISAPLLAPALLRVYKSSSASLANFSTRSPLPIYWSCACAKTAAPPFNSNRFRIIVSIDEVVRSKFTIQPHPCSCNSASSTQSCITARMTSTPPAWTIISVAVKLAVTWCGHTKKFRKAPTPYHWTSRREVANLVMAATTMVAAPACKKLTIFNS